LNQKSCFADTGACQNGSQFSGVKMLAGFFAQQAEWVSLHKVFDEHDRTPLFKKVGSNGECRFDKPL
jgi:hypothetical protein